MRHLSSKQKKMLTEWFTKNKHKVTFNFDVQEDCFPIELFDEIVEANDYETIVQDMNVFLTDMVAQSISF